MASAAPTTAGGAAAPASSTTTKTTSDLDSIIITGVSTRDVRFPTKDYIGDAMNPDPDYSGSVQHSAQPPLANQTSQLLGRLTACDV